MEASTGRVRATGGGRRLVRKSGRGFGGVRTLTPLVEESLKEKVPFPLEGSRWALSDSRWRRAYEDYTGASR